MLDYGYNVDHDHHDDRDDHYHHEEHLGEGGGNGRKMLDGHGYEEHDWHHHRPEETFATAQASAVSSASSATLH